MKETLQLCANPWDGNGRNVSCRTVLKLCFGLDILVRHRKVKDSHLLSLVSSFSPQGEFRGALVLWLSVIQTGVNSTVFFHLAR
jgi:cytochrome c oxidase subunit IV